MSNNLGFISVPRQRAEVPNWLLWVLAALAALAAYKLLSPAARAKRRALGEAKRRYKTSRQRIERQYA